MRPIERRDFLRAGGVALLGAVAVACGGGGKKGATATAGKSLNEIIAGRPQNASLVHANAEVLPGLDDRFAFGLFDPQDPSNRVQADSARIWIAQTREEPATGPFTAPYRGEGLDERGVFSTRVTFPSDGAWLVIAEATAGGQTFLGGTTVGVGRQHELPIPGEKAISTATPTAKDHQGVEPYCTRLIPGTAKREPCDMHAVSLDAALKAGRPVVLLIASPAFCESRLCGPEVELVQDVSKELGDRADFIHVEYYRDDKDAPAQRLLAPAALAWKATVEPATYFIGADGMVADRFIGPMDRAETRAATEALLA